MGVFKRPAKKVRGQNQYWWIRFWHNKEEYCETTGKKVGEITKDQARDMLRERQYEVKYGIKKNPQRNNPGDSENLSLYEAIIKYIQQKKLEGIDSWERSLQSLNKILDHVHDPNMPVANVDEDVIKKIIKGRLKQVLPSSVARDLKPLRNMFYYLIRWGEYPYENPVKIPKGFENTSLIRRYIRPEEWELIWNASPEFFKDILMGAINFGARRHEIAAAHEDFVDLKGNYIEFPESKSCNKRKIFFNETIKEEMPRLIEESYNGYLFKNSRGRNYDANNTNSLNAITRMFKKICLSVGIDDLSFHCIRHTTATWLFQGHTDEKGNKKMANLPEVKYILGHKNANTTMIYAHPEDSVQEAVELIEVKIKSN